jgi:hypothetical protein
MPYDQLGKILLVFGTAILVLGLVFLLFGRTPLSVLLTIIANVLLRLFNK